MSLHLATVLRLVIQVAQNALSLGTIIRPIILNWIQFIFYYLLIHLYIRLHPFISYFPGIWFSLKYIAFLHFYLTSSLDHVFHSGIEHISNMQLICIV